MEIFWLVLLVGFIVLEAVTTQLVCIWFAGGALSALICALFDLSKTIQVAVFVVVSVLLLVFTKKFVDKLKSKTEAKTNVDALIGETAVVIEDISNIDSKGCVKLRGIEWSARSNDGEVIPADSYVVVKGIDGVKLIVEKLEK